MPVRIPKARSSEMFTFGIAGVAGLAPLYMMMPGATERMATQTARWAPKWYVNTNPFSIILEFHHYITHGIILCLGNTLV